MKIWVAEWKSGGFAAYKDKQTLITEIIEMLQDRGWPEDYLEVHDDWLAAGESVSAELVELQ